MEAQYLCRLLVVDHRISNAILRLLTSISSTLTKLLMLAVNKHPVDPTKWLAANKYPLLILQSGWFGG